MKVCTNELLLLGGIYQFLALFVSVFNNELAYAIEGVMFILFWVTVLSMSFGWVPNLVYVTNNHLPRLSVFLAYIGWIPYFSVLYALLSLGTDYVLVGSDSVTVILNNYMPVYEVYMGIIVLSLIMAAYKVFYLKEDLTLDCQLTRNL